MGQSRLAASRRARAAAGGSAGSGNRWFRRRCWTGRERRRRPRTALRHRRAGRPERSRLRSSPSKISPLALSPGAGVPEQRGQFVAAARDQGLAGGADRRQRHHVDRGARCFRPASLPDRPRAAARPPAGHGWSGADGRPWWRQTGCGRSAAGTAWTRASLRPTRKQSRMPDSAASRSCSASGPALKAASASTSTIWRSSRAK